MADAIRLVLTNMPTILFVAALAIATFRRDGPPARRYLSWLLLLSVGAEMIWGGFFHVFLPQVAAAQIGWQVSPFQFEIGVADLSIGVVAVLSFWRSLSFKAAVVLYLVLFNIGVAIGHVREAVVNANFSPDNFGLLLLLTIIKVPLLAWLLWKAYREERELQVR
ncbi:hypothetical protein OCK02_25185 [Rhizobium sp. TRM96647]|uniref:DUF6790 family protein n=1 Tax=unclassified Rhizobium TaxID=2613769 RepID=UPI0021E889F5|nr:MULTISPECIES: DUF6790 family protein [unclassified Rhizobium]MCV3739439.1 hypothetical protein [Rhizobium sp. TRM96647]MCV3761099.1 hypothetical protein [Rhizobium sp. TRM96650]